MPQDIASPIIAGEAAILARRYAGAFYELAEEQGQLDAVAGDLRGLRILRNESQEFRFICGGSRLTRAQLVKAVGQVAKPRSSTNSPPISSRSSRVIAGLICSMRSLPRFFRNSPHSAANILPRFPPRRRLRPRSRTNSPRSSAAGPAARCIFRCARNRATRRPRRQDGFAPYRRFTAHQAFAP